MDGNFFAYSAVLQTIAACLPIVDGQDERFWAVPKAAALEPDTIRSSGKIQQLRFRVNEF